MFEEYPPALLPATPSSGPNQPITVYEGAIQLKGSRTDYAVDGKIEFAWLPSPHARITGVSMGNSLMTANEISFTLATGDGSVSGDVTVLLVSNVNGEERIEGMGHGIVIGDKSIPVNKIRFEVPNFWCYSGEPVQSGNGWFLGRLAFGDQSTSIVIDKIQPLERKKDLRAHGGYELLCTGELTTYEALNYADSMKILLRLGNFLSFLNGRRTLPMFFLGLTESSEKWKDFSFDLVDPYKDVHSWFVDLKRPEIDQLWINFAKICDDDDSWDCMNTAIHWYLEANANVGRVEGSIVMTHNALELLFHWLCMEDKKIIVADGSTKLSMVNKIRLLLNTIGIAESHPVFMTELEEYLKVERTSALQTFVRLRNAVVHPSRENRQVLNKIPRLVRHRVLQVGLWYLELTLLFMLGHKGKYLSRCSNQIENPPWVKS